MQKQLTPSLEDYLKTIWEISLTKKTVRVKDIIKKLGFKVSSVVSALNILKEKKLIYHEKYGYIELTNTGVAKAREIYERHQKLTRFFTKVLNVDKKIAQEDACNIEHYLNKKTYENLLKFMNYIEETSDFSDAWLKKFKTYSKTKKITKRSTKMKLSELKAGEKGIIKKITGNIQLKQRLLSMGILPGESVSIEKIAPLGDPIDISVKSYHLTLRKEEADSITIEKL